MFGRLIFNSKDRKRRVLSISYVDFVFSTGTIEGLML